MLAWSQVEGLTAFYMLWVALGLVMAAVLYEPAFTCSPSSSRPPASAGFAASAVGLVGISQIPGRVLFGLIAGRIPDEWATAMVFALIAIGIAVVVGVDSTGTVVAGLVLLGMDNGMATSPVRPSSLTS